MKISRQSIPLLVPALFAFAACSGGGGSSGPAVSGKAWAPANGPGDVDQYFPHAQGDRWSFNAEASATGAGSTSGVLSLEVLAPQTVLGVSASVFAETSSTDQSTIQSYYHTSGGGVTYLGDDDSADLVTSQLVPYPCFLFPAALGLVSRVHASRLPFGTDDLGHPLYLETTQTIENLHFDSLTCFAGSFTGVVEQRTSTDGVVTDPALNIAIPFTSNATRWFAGGAGLVRQASTLVMDGLTTSSSAQVRGFRVDGVSHGVGEELTVLDQLSPDDGYSSPPFGLPVVASDGTDFLVVGREIGGANPSYTSRWVAQRVAADGTLPGARLALEPASEVIDVFNPRRAAIVFDGLDYLVVHEQDEGPSLSGWRHSLVAVRVSTAGELVGAPTVVVPSTDALPAAFEPALAFDGVRCLLAFVRRDASGLTRASAVFLSPATGTADGAEFALSAAAGYQSAPALAFDGVRYLAAWNQATWMGSLHGVLATRVSTQGSVLDPAGILVHDIAVDPELVPASGGVLVLWPDTRLQPGGTSNNLFGNRVAPDGGLLDGEPSGGAFALTSTMGRAQVAPAIAAFDGGLALAWFESSSPGVFEGLHGTWLSSAAAPQAPATDVLLTERAFQQRPRLAAGAQSALLVWVEPFSVSVPTTRVRALSLFPRAH